MRDVVVLGAARTPVGSFLGTLSAIPATKLGSIAIEEAVKRAGIKKEMVDEVIMGCVLTSGLGQAPARQAALGAGLSMSTPALTVGKVCGSGLKSVMLATQAIALKDSEIAVAAQCFGAGRGEEEILTHRVVTRDQAETVAYPRRRIGQCFAYFTNERKLFASLHERHRRGNIDDHIEIHGTTLFELANVNFLEWIAQARANIYAPCVGMAQEWRVVAKHTEPAHFARRMRTDVIRSKTPAWTIEEVGGAFHGAGVASKTARHRRFTGSSPRKA